MVQAGTQKSPGVGVFGVGVGDVGFVRVFVFVNLTQTRGNLRRENLTEKILQDWLVGKSG